MAIALLLAVIAAVYQLNSLRWMEDLQELTPELNQLKEKDKRVREHMLSIEPGRFILVTGENLESALQTTERACRKLNQLKERGLVDGYFGLYPWLLSSRQQRQNQVLLKESLTDKNLILWRKALKQSGLSVERLGHFGYPDISPLIPSEVLATSVKRIVDNRIITAENQTIIMIWLTNHQPEAVKQAFSNMVGARYFSQRDLIHNISRSYTDKARGLLLIGLLLIVILLIGRYKSVTQAIQTLLPAITAAVLIAGAFATSQAAVSFLHLVGFLLAVSICVDYGIFYRENRSGNISLTYQAMAASMLTSTLAFSCLLSAESSSLKILASVVSLGVILGFLLCPVIIQRGSENPTVNYKR
jgi:predicted exporter